jgi:hypothetical protein
MSTIITLSGFGRLSEILGSLDRHARPTGKMTGSPFQNHNRKQRRFWLCSLGECLPVKSNNRG